MSIAASTSSEGRRAARDSLVVALGGQVERAVGTLTSLALRWWLDPSRLGVYSGLRLYLDNTNRTSLGVGLGAVQEIPVLLASGRVAEAKHLADVAHTTNTITCLIYSFLLILWAWLGSASRSSDPLSMEWTWGLVAVAFLAILKRHESFLIAVLRAHRQFDLTTRVDVLEGIVSAILVSLGLLIAGFWGLMASVALIILAKIAYLHASHPLRFFWAWDFPIAARLFREGLPILANTAAFGAVLNLDRALILALVPDGNRAAGLYSIALLGTSWSLDVAGRIVTVLYPYFQTTLGRTGDVRLVSLDAVKATEAQAPLLFGGGAVAFVIGPACLGALMPRYVDGLAAIRPLMPGMVLLGLAWPARQMLIAVGHPYRLALATFLGLIVTAIAGAIGARNSGIVGVAWGMTIGYGVVFLATSAVAFAGLGLRLWLTHLTRLAAILIGFSVAASLASFWPIPGSTIRTISIRLLIFSALTALPLALWLRNRGLSRRSLLASLTDATT